MHMLPFGVHHVYDEVLSEARQDASVGRYADADHALARFSEQHPGTDEALETNYWRAVVRLDQGDREASTPALSLLDRYIATSASLPHRLEAITLRHLASQLDAAARLASANVTTPTSAPHASIPSSIVSLDLRARDDEIQRLKDELAKANDELDRIKRRLATPKP